MELPLIENIQNAASELIALKKAQTVLLYADQEKEYQKVPVLKGMVQEEIFGTRFCLNY